MRPDSPTKSPNNYCMRPLSFCFFFFMFPSFVSLEIDVAFSVSRDQILRHEREQKNIHFPCSADHEQDWQPYRLIHTLAICMCDHTYILHACAPTARRSHLTTIVCVLFRFCYYFFMFPSFVSLEIDVAFSEYFVPLLSSVCMESTSYLFPFRMVFSYLVTTGWILTSAYVRIQSITQPSSTYTPPPLFYCCTECGGKTHHHQQ